MIWAAGAATLTGLCLFVKKAKKEFARLDSEIDEYLKS